jgi:hypothetical protein
VYALHGLASNSDAIAIDYRIDPKALLVEIIYHTCSVQASKTDMKRSKKESLGFAKMVRDALKVMCMEQELEFHISVARGDGVGSEKDYGLRVRGHQTDKKATWHFSSIYQESSPWSVGIARSSGRPNAQSDDPPLESGPARRRISVACNRCRKRKIRCSGDPGNGKGCTICREAGMEASSCRFSRIGSDMSAWHLSSQDTP